ncbi:MAG: hypothetical protein ACKOOI_16240, partial [Pirellula sp.]
MTITQEIPESHLLAFLGGRLPQGARHIPWLMSADGGYEQGTGLTLLTALTGLTADIVDENDLIGWVNSLA